MPYDDYSGAFSYGGQDYYEPLSFPSEDGVGGAALPFEVNIVPNSKFPVTGKPSASIGAGNLFEAPYLPKLLTPTNKKAVTKGSLSITGESIVYIKRDHPSDILTFVIDAHADGDAFTPHEPEDWITSTASPSPPLTAFFHPIATIVNNPDARPNATPAQQYVVRQMVTSHLVLTTICFGGRSAKTFVPI